MEELDELREELLDARTEAARLAEELAEREARSRQAGDEVERLRREVAAARQETAQTRDAVATETRRLMERYRAALLRSAPEVPSELVQGASTEELDRSLTTARELVTRVQEEARRQIQAQAAASIPTGSPVRGGPGPGALTPAEKIRAGIAERQ